MSLSYSSNQIETRILDPVRYSANRFCEWELNELDMRYMPNMRICNLGATSATGGVYYNKLGGVKNLIKNIVLFDGRQELDRLNEASIWNAFQTTRDTNIHNKSVGTVLSRGNYYYEFENGYSVGNSPRTALATDADDTPKGWVDVRDMLELLNNIPALDTNRFTNLRLRIEFETSPYRVSSGNTAINTIEPVLVCDVSSQKMPTPSSVQWNAIERDEFSIPEQQATSTTQPLLQNTSMKLNGFQNKIVERMVLIKQFEDVSKMDGMELRNGSLAIYGEQLQVRLNGANRLPIKIDRDNKRTALMADAWGNMNVAPFCNRTSSSLKDAGVPSAILGVVDYTGLHLGQFVKDLQIEISRNNLDDSDTASASNQALRVHCYGEVKKALVFQNDGYLVQYS